jgi:hypothetical protein
MLLFDARATLRKRADKHAVLILKIIKKRLLEKIN